MKIRVEFKGQDFNFNEIKPLIKAIEKQGYDIILCPIFAENYSSNIVFTIKKKNKVEKNER